MIPIASTEFCGLNFVHVLQRHSQNGQLQANKLVNLSKAI